MKAFGILLCVVIVSANGIETFGNDATSGGNKTSVTRELPVNVTESFGNEMTSVGNNTTVTRELPPLVCFKIPLDEACSPDCHPNESHFRCLLRGFLPIAILVLIIVVVFCCVCFCCYYYHKIVLMMSGKYQETIGNAMLSKTHDGWQRLGSTPERV